MKKVDLILVILSLAVSSECLTMSWGSIRPRNLLLFDQFFHETQIESKKFEFSTNHGSLITAIHVTDLTNQQDGGSVRIVQGGIGFNFVRLEFIPEFNKQMLLNVEIFGN